MLAKCFLDLSAYATKAVRRSLRSTSHSPSSPPDIPSDDHKLFPPTELDMMLPKVCEALVLVTQCIITITLEEGENELRDAALGHSWKAFFSETCSDGGIVENLLGKASYTRVTITSFFIVINIELLRHLDVFLPRINFGRPVHFSSSGVKDTQTTSAPAEGSVSDPTGFQYLKRDLVRLLGILCHGAKAVQDLVRTCGGIPVVMNMCVIDERNPCKSIFSYHVPVMRD